MIIQSISLPDHSTVFTNIVVLFSFWKFEKITIVWRHKNGQRHMVEFKKVAGMGGRCFVFKHSKVVVKS